MESKASFDLDDIEDFDFDDEADTTDLKIDPKSPGYKVIKRDKEFVSTVIINNISNGELENGYDETFDKTDSLVSLIELLDKEKIFKLPIGEHYFVYEMLNGPKKDKEKFLLWSQHQVLNSSNINEHAKIEILKIFNTVIALTVFGKIEWQIATV